MSVSIANILTQEYIFEGFRTWIEKTFPYNRLINYLVNCPVCTSFWTGLFCSFLFPSVIWWSAPFISCLVAKVFVIWENK